MLHSKPAHREQGLCGHAEGRGDRGWRGPGVAGSVLAPSEAAGLPGHGMGMSSVPLGTGYPTQPGVWGSDAAWEGSVPMEEPQRVLGTCHTCCPSSVPRTKAYLQRREGDAPAVRWHAAGLCSVQFLSHVQPSPGSAPHPSDCRQTRWELAAPGPWQNRSLSCHGATGFLCVQGLKQAGLVVFFQSAASSSREVLHIPGQVPR